MDRKTEAGGRHLPGSDENKVGNRKIGLTDFCESLEQEYPYAHAIGNIRAIIGADWIKPTEKVKRVQAVLDELNQRVLERCVGGTDTNVRSKLTLQEERFYEAFFQEIFAEVPDVDLSLAWKQDKQRLHAAEVRCRNLFKMVTEYQDIIVPGYRKRAETAEEIASDLRDDFTDFVTGGIHNAAPYCANRRPECVNAHGWCDGDNRVCRGFMPKAAARNKDCGSDVSMPQPNQAADPQR